MKTKRTFFVCFFAAVFLAACGGGDGGGSGNSGTVKKLLSKNNISAYQEVEVFQYDELNRVIEIEGFFVPDNFPLYHVKIEYSGADPRPTREIYEDGIYDTFSYTQYEYGEDNYAGKPTKYYQTLFVDGDGAPFGLPAQRNYLDAQNRVIASGFFQDGVFFSDGASYTYDDRDNLIKVEQTDTSVGGGYDLSTTRNVYTVEYVYDNKKSPLSGAETPRWRWLFSYYGGSPNNVVGETYTLSRNGVIAESGNRFYSYTYDESGYPVQFFWGGEMVSSYEYIPAR